MSVDLASRQAELLLLRDRLLQAADNLVADEAGTDGTRRACAAATPEERLEAIPYATLCLDDRRRLERG